MPRADKSKKFYKPELTQRKAKLFARCFTHCLTCDEIEIDEQEKIDILHFINHVNETDFLNLALKRLEERDMQRKLEKVIEENQSQDPAE